MDEMHLSAVTQLLSAKARVEAAGERPGMEDLLALLYSATQVWVCGGGLLVGVLKCWPPGPGGGVAHGLSLLLLLGLFLGGGCRLPSALAALQLITSAPAPLRPARSAGCQAVCLSVRHLTHSSTLSHHIIPSHTPTLTHPHLQARTFFVSRLSAGLRNDTDDGMLEMRQRWRLADVRLEEYCFVVLSRVINALEEQVGGEGGRSSLEEGGQHEGRGGRGICERF